MCKREGFTDFEIVCVRPQLIVAVPPVNYSDGRRTGRSYSGMKATLFALRLNELLGAGVVIRKLF